MPSGIDYEELSALSEDVFEALDNVLDDTTPGVIRLALTSISMLRFIETAVLDMTAKDLDSIEEMRRLQRSELQAAKATEERMNQAMDTAVKDLAVEIAKSVCKFKHNVGGIVAKLEAREVKGEELDQVLKAARATQEHTRTLVNEPVDLSGLGYVLSNVRDVCCVADFEIDPVLADQLHHWTPVHAIAFFCDQQHQLSSENRPV
jgi:hypothetical protein